ncbi:hypothetical protein GQ44DRAFT_628127 [Phaeosphaeriaceae sp. PMI808]|nr:hypothetical protein GQ44DRAFT_628127 [Phaeosphaeriaceae sp. PMI808]
METTFLVTHGQNTNNAQSRHEITGNGDTWQEELDEVTNESALQKARVADAIFIHCELPMCWTYMGKHAVRCLIDTGAQINLMRLSAARAMKVTYEEMIQDPMHVNGMVTANGGMDPFIGTAWNVGVRIGEVTTTTHFRIVANLTKSAILGGPWCASARLAIQYNVFGRITCRVLSDNGSRNAVFIASDPAPFHPEQMVSSQSGKAVRDQ